MSEEKEVAKEEKDELQSFLEKWAKRLEIIKNPKNWRALIFGSMVMLVGWAFSDGEVRKTVEPYLLSDCFDSEDYPLGQWTYQAKIQVGHAEYVLDHYLILKTPNEGHTLSDYCGRGKFVIKGEFKPNNPIEYQYTDNCGYCSLGYLDFDGKDGCSLTGRVYGFQNCPANYPDVPEHELSAAKKITAEYEWIDRPYLWEFWARK